MTVSDPSHTSPRRSRFPRAPWRIVAAERRLTERTWSLERQIAALEVERRDLRRILNGLGEGVLAVDRAGVVVKANRRALELLEMDPATSVGSHMFVAVPHPAACDAIEDVMRGSERTRMVREISIDRPDGETTLTVSIRPLRNVGIEDGEPEGAIAVVRDITELRRLERSRQDFFTNVSHELKTPITAIRGAIETVLDDESMPEEVRTRFLDGARRHSLRLGALVTDLLSLARLEDDPRALQREPLDLAWLAEDIARSCAGAAERAGVTVTVSTSGHEAARWVVPVDEEAMRQALTNLIDNAIAHSDRGAGVTIALDGGSLDGAVELVVRDHGAGIPAESLDRIFERFYRVDAARSRARGGTGIGLSIVKHVAQAHGGAVTVTSEVGVGSEFILRIPVSPGRALGT